MIVFMLFIFAWFFVGVCGVANCKKDRVNYEMIAFIGVTPVIPLIAKFCGLF